MLCMMRIHSLLGTENLPENITDLLDEDLMWKLGAGENRVATYLDPSRR